VDPKTFTAAPYDLTSMSTASPVLFRIGELSRRTGVSTRSLRYYEQQGLLLAARTSGGQRLYDSGAAARVDLIQLLFGAGVPSTGIVQLLPCITSGTTTPAMVERLEQERDRITSEYERLQRTLLRMDEILGEARRRLDGAAPISA
jgi:DNA-binding transcriptional MerR regulator